MMWRMYGRIPLPKVSILFTGRRCRAVLKIGADCIVKPSTIEAGGLDRDVGI